MRPIGRHAKSKLEGINILPSFPTRGHRQPPQRHQGCHLPAVAVGVDADGLTRVGTASRRGPSRCSRPGRRMPSRALDASPTPPFSCYAGSPARRDRVFPTFRLFRHTSGTSSQSDQHPSGSATRPPRFYSDRSAGRGPRRQSPSTSSRGSIPRCGELPPVKIAKAQANPET